MASSNVTILDEVKTLNYIGTQILVWGLLVCFIFGPTGFLLNIYVFLQPALRKNPCSMYFLSSSVAGLIFLGVSVPFRVLQYQFNIDPTYYILSFCKIEYYITFSSRALTSWFLVLACMDRYLCSSPDANVRKWSSFKVAARAIPLTVLIAYIAYIHMPIFYTINKVPPICAGEAGFYRIFLGFWNIIAYGSGPPFVMFVFSFLTIQRLKHRRILPATSSTGQDRTNYIKDRTNDIKDRNLFRMALAQCLCIGLTTSFFSATQLYISLKTNAVKDSLEIAKENLISILGGLISTAGHSATFYLYTVTSKMFRQYLICRHPTRT